MKVAMGKSILNGIAIGPLHIVRKEEIALAVESGCTPAEEWARFESACRQAKEQLCSLHEKANDEAGEENADIFEIHRMMLEDEDYLEAVRNIIETQETTAEYAAATTGEHFSAVFSAIDDAYMQARAADVKDISERVVNILSGRTQANLLGDEPVILVADDLTPSQTVQMDKSKLLGFITRYGSSNSHTAILARTMNIPALIGVDFEADWDGKMAVLDGYSGCVYVEPTADLLSAMKSKRIESLKQEAQLQGLKGKRNVTLDGREINVYANIGNVADVSLAMQNDAGGVGLFRSEFIYLEAFDFPSEDYQFSIYKRMVEALGGRKVIFRTLDIGADKQVPYFNLGREDNPALGYRAIRICLTRRDIFKQQLRAMLRASAYGTVSIMFPMIISVQELLDAKKVVEECRTELRAEGSDMGETEIGVMIETPAAVMMADELAEEADFFSIGTNDLSQYTLAIDRQNPKLEPFFDPHHPAILRMIRHTIEAGHRHNCWVGICGELGADLTLTESFLRMGVDELSVAPAAVLPLRKKIRSLDLRKKFPEPIHSCL